MPILEARGVPVSDFSDLLEDDDFFDAVPPRYSGQVKKHAALRAMALQSLAEMGTQVEP